mmetsp:Transcript_3412/g.9261  ORF Transcript_3412/g.9261 Transcript_3412/m.9261 type:complete len:201 (-) Transcript_3412:197-799(-)
MAIMAGLGASLMLAVRLWMSSTVRKASWYMPSSVAHRSCSKRVLRYSRSVSGLLRSGRSRASLKRCRLVRCSRMRSHSLRNSGLRLYVTQKLYARWATEAYRGSTLELLRTTSSTARYDSQRNLSQGCSSSRSVRSRSLSALTYDSMISSGVASTSRSATSTVLASLSVTAPSTFWCAFRSRCLITSSKLWTFTCWVEFL